MAHTHLALLILYLMVTGPFVLFCMSCVGKWPAPYWWECVCVSRSQGKHATDVTVEEADSQL